MKKFVSMLAVVVMALVFVPAAPADAAPVGGYFACGGVDNGGRFTWPKNKTHLTISFPKHWEQNKYGHAAVHAAVMLDQNSNWTTSAMAAHGADADVIVSSYYDPSDGAWGRGGIRYVTRPNGCVIAEGMYQFNTHHFLPANVIQGQVNQIAVHELGHAIGLDHVPDTQPNIHCNPKSIMTPFVTWWPPSCAWQWFEAIDRWHINSWTPPPGSLGASSKTGGEYPADFEPVP